MNHLEFEYIDTTKRFSAYRSSISQRGIRTIAVDIEGEFNLHIYGEHFCLLQIYDGQQSVVVDPLTVDIEEIKSFFEDRNIGKIAYDAASDRALLFKNHHIRMRGIIDLRPAVELLDFQKKGLSSVIESALQIPPSSGKKRFQQYNWTRRPIDDAAIEYALSDVIYLFELRDFLFRELLTRKLFDRYLVDNLKVQDTDPETNRDPGVLRSGQFSHLQKKQQLLFRDLFSVRDRHAQRLNVPPNTALANKRLFAIVSDTSLLQRSTPSRGVGRDAFDAMVDEMQTVIEKHTRSRDGNS